MIIGIMNTDTASSAAANSATSMTIDGDGPATTDPDTRCDGDVIDSRQVQTKFHIPSDLPIGSCQVII